MGFKSAAEGFMDFDFLGRWRLALIGLCATNDKPIARLF
jgi:hypothetical protein